MMVMGAAMLAMASASAQNFPNRLVKIIVPQAPGGASDALARIVGQRLGEQWKQPVVIENRVGAGGNIGMEAVARSAPDGYTILMSYVGTHAINPSLYKKLSFDADRDFAAVATIATVPFVAIANSQNSIKTIGDLAVAAKTRRVTYGSAGNGSVTTCSARCSAQPRVPGWSMCPIAARRPR